MVDDADVEIAKLVQAGESNLRIARALGCNRARVAKIRAGLPDAPSPEFRGSRPTDPARVAAAVEAHAGGATVGEASARSGISTRVLYRALERAPAASAAAPVTARDRQIDGLIAGSLTWRLVQEAIVRALRGHPEAAAAVVRELRTVRL